MKITLMYNLFRRQILLAAVNGEAHRLFHVCHEFLHGSALAERFRNLFALAHVAASDRIFFNNNRIFCHPMIHDRVMC